MSFDVGGPKLTSPLGGVGGQNRALPPIELKALSRRGDRGAVKLGRDFHTHDFEQHAHPSAVVQMRETAKGLREWSGQYAYFLANLETVIRANGRHSFHMRRPTPQSRPTALACGCSAPMIREATPNVPLTLRQRCLERSMMMKI